jgi:predicted RNA-binding protein YlxR (DUF448 family)
MTALATETELDRGPRDRGVERMCVATRTVRPIADLIRFVIGPDGEAVPDLKHKLPGRGVWITATQNALRDAIKSKAFGRGFNRDVRLPDDLVARTEQLLVRSALAALAVAGKASQVVAGLAKVEAALEHKDVAALLHAAEAAADGVRKLDSALRRAPQADSIPVVRILTSEQLDLALGRPNVVHAALITGPSSDTVLARLRRLERFRNGDLDQEAGAGVPN